MIYPKGIVDFIRKNIELSNRFGNQILTHSLHSTKEKPLKKENDEFEIWLIKEGYRESSEIRRYLAFLLKISKIFNEIYKTFKKINPERINKKDYNSIQISPQELLYIARYLYFLNSYGVAGDVLECGCFKGFSSCCLSWVCNFLGKKLIIADSFEGLPINYETTGKKSYYRPHDFKGDLEEVKENINRFGKPDQVEFIKGWYNKSLLKFNYSICLLIMDVDLYGSAKDILNNIFAKLVKGGIIFSHEFSKIALDENNINYKAKYLIGDLGIVIPYINEDERILLSPHKEKTLENYINCQKFQGLNNFLTFKMKNNLIFSLIIQIISKDIYLRNLLKLSYFLSRF